MVVEYGIVILVLKVVLTLTVGSKGIQWLKTNLIGVVKWKGLA